MHCRSALLLKKELEELCQEPIWGISIRQVPHHPLICFANLSGIFYDYFLELFFNLDKS